MTYTTDQARQRAQEVGALIFLDTVGLPNAELTAYANLIRKETLLEAADEFQKFSRYGFADTIEFLRRMAEGE